MLTFLLYAVLAWLGYKLLTLVVNLFFFPVLRPEKLKGPPPRVSLLVPARNESHNLEETIPGFLLQGVQEILILDDHSDDPTADDVRAAAQRDPRVRLIQGLPRPEGWMGKNWACHQLAEAASGEVLIFTDADVRWRRRGVRSVLAMMEGTGAGLLSVYPRHLTGSLAERVYVPMIDDALLCYLPYPLVWTPFPSAAAANGQVMAFTRDAYLACGGHQGVKGEVLEDVKLAQRVKASGHRLAVALGGDLIAVRMYRHFEEIVEGLGKNLIEFHLKSRPLLLLSFAAHLTAYTLCWLLIQTNPLWLLAGLMGLVERVLVSLKTGREWWEFVVVPLAPLYSIPIYLRSAARKYTWKGREYVR